MITLLKIGLGIQRCMGQVGVNLRKNSAFWRTDQNHGRDRGDRDARGIMKEISCSLVTSCVAGVKGLPKSERCQTISKSHFQIS